ncbi:MAG: HipA domain-containing protein [Firmicutes bacterium]|nr:HipA domain-containing protein [Bacillota bacterium]
MIDFNKGTEIANKFLGSEKKKTIIYNDDIYMVKFPDPVRKKNNPLSYMNNQYSEYIGCEIFRTCGFNTQETILGTYKHKDGNISTVVGCKDFTQDGSILYEFSKFANALNDYTKKARLSIEDVELVIMTTEAISDNDKILDRFWDVFVIDALIGHSDRHLDNWGLLEKEGTMVFAPVYDCGSALSPLIDEENTKLLLNNETDFVAVEYNVTSCYTIEQKRIFYHEIFKNPPKKLSEAIIRITPKINMCEVHKIVNGTEGLSDERKEYLIKSLNIRYERIILPAYNNQKHA